MARIRTVKPELFRHEALYDLEEELGLPVRTIFIGLFTVADREGRFKWRPRSIKSEIAPFDNIDMERVLYALATRGFLVKYAWNGQYFGVIPSFNRHQVINNKEKVSELPSPDDAQSSKISDFSMFLTRDSRVEDACPPPLFLDQGERKGREGNKERKGKEGISQNADLNSKVWEAYRSAYLDRYKLEPVRNASVNSKISQLAKRLGTEAIDVVSFFVKHPDSFYVKSMHAIGLCLKDAESLSTQFRKGRAITGTDIRNYERQQGHIQLLADIEKGGV